MNDRGKENTEVNVHIIQQTITKYPVLLDKKHVKRREKEV